MPPARSGAVEDLADEAVEAIGESGERRAAAVAEHDVVAQLAAGLFEQHRQAAVDALGLSREPVSTSDMGGVSLRSRGNPVPDITLHRVAPPPHSGVR